MAPHAHFINPQGHAGEYAAWTQTMDACMGWHTRGMMAGAQKVCSPGGAKGFSLLCNKKFYFLLACFKRTVRRMGLGGVERHRVGYLHVRACQRA